jgi:hypothetical protein
MATLRSKWACCVSIVAKKHRQNSCIGKHQFKRRRRYAGSTSMAMDKETWPGATVSAGLATAYQKHSPDHRLIPTSGLQQTFVWLRRAANAVIE